ncbi:MAG: hypothetical protein LBQ18_01120 [Campylobacteraceae bacterium]|nr:hypothetical protein [Campylobacteraceae bacterium]
MKTNGGINFFGLLTIVFITLKLTEVINWSWIWVLVFFWLPFAIVIVAAIAIFVWHILKYLYQKIK